MPLVNHLSAVINQANLYYNYTIGFEHINVDLLRTGSKLLKSGITKAVFFSDFKCLYLDDDGVQLETISPQARQWDSVWKINFTQNIPRPIAEQFLYSITLSYHEKKLGLNNNTYSKPYLRAELSPFVIEDHESYIPIHVSVKIYNDGIAILSFQLDINASIGEESFIEETVNIYRHYFKSIWVDAVVQRLDAEEILPNAFDEVFTVAGNRIHNWRTYRLLKRMRKKSKSYLDECLSKNGQVFEIGEDSVELHEIAGSKYDASDELSIDLCRGQYINAISSLMVSADQKKKINSKSFIWVGRPSISLLRFKNQPASKDLLYENFNLLLIRILGRTSEINITYGLPTDLRPFNDYCLHGNRALLLWTWLKPANSPESWWDHEDATSNVLENQARAEHVEYHNMRTERAASWAHSPPSTEHLGQSFKDLALTEDILHHSSQAGEVTDALESLLNEFGTTKLIVAGKESARWHLDEMRYKADLKRSQIDRIITFIFGLVGTTGLAEFAIKPYVKSNNPSIGPVELPLTSLAISALIIFSTVALIYVLNKPTIKS